MRLLSLAAALALALPSLAQAHGIWIAQRTGELAIVYGHGGSDDAYDPAKVSAVAARTAAGASAPVKIARRERNVVIAPAEEAAVVTVVFDGGFWAKTREGKWVNKGRREVPDADNVSHSLKYNTTVLAGTGGPLAPQGLPLEIVPLADPMTLKPGDDLPVQVLKDGKPLAGVGVMADYVNESHGASMTTDAEGKVVVVVRNDGLNVIAVSASEPMPGDADVDRKGLFATLSFMLPHVE